MRSKKLYFVLPAIVCAAVLSLTACGAAEGDDSPADSGSTASAERDDHDHEGRYGDTGRDGDGASGKIGNAVNDIGDTAGDVITGAGDTVGDVVTGAADDLISGSKKTVMRR